MLCSSKGDLCYFWLAVEIKAEHLNPIRDWADLKLVFSFCKGCSVSDSLLLLGYKPLRRATWNLGWFQGFLLLGRPWIPVSLCSFPAAPQHLWYQQGNQEEKLNQTLGSHLWASLLCGILAHQVLAALLALWFLQTNVYIHICTHTHIQSRFHNNSQLEDWSETNWPPLIGVEILFLCSLVHIDLPHSSK